jgi:hypothetical protein
MGTTRTVFAALLLASPALGQTPADPFPAPIPASEGVILVDYDELAPLPDIDGVAARMMLLVDEPGTRRLFVNDMRGPLYTVGYDGRNVTQYLNINDPRWGVRVQAMGRERGFQSFALHPQFGQPGTPGFGKIYTWTDSENTEPTADFRPSGGDDTHDLVLLEWTARTPTAATYDGGAARELMRFEQPFTNHNGGMIGFNPFAGPGDADFGLLYVGVADGGSGGDPLEHAQNLASGFGKVFRIDPLGTDSPNGRYGIPASNPFAGDGNDATLGEIYAYGVRNPQHFGWDRQTGTMFLTDIGQGTVEELSVVERGGNLGWNDWEGSFAFSGRTISLDNQRGDPEVTYPIAEYAQLDPLLQSQSAATGVHVYRGDAIPQLANLIVWGDLPSGEIFYVSADRLPTGGQSAIRRILLNHDGRASTLLQLVQIRNGEQGKTAATRVDLRFGAGPEGRVYLLNKQDGVIRVLVP